MKIYWKYWDCEDLGKNRELEECAIMERDTKTRQERMIFDYATGKGMATGIDLNHWSLWDSANLKEERRKFSAMKIERISKAEAFLEVLVNG